MIAWIFNGTIVDSIEHFLFFIDLNFFDIFLQLRFKLRIFRFRIWISMPTLATGEVFINLWLV